MKDKSIEKHTIKINNKTIGTYSSIDQALDCALKISYNDVIVNVHCSDGRVIEFGGNKEPC